MGRDRSSTVVVDDPLVSPRHAEIRRREDGTYQIVDLGSRRGTFRGDRRVSDALLRDGDKLLVGTGRLRFEAAKDAKATGAGRQLNGQSYLPASEVADTAQLRRDYEKLRAAFEVSQALSEAQGLPGLLGAVLDTAFRVLAADRGLIMLFDPVTLQPTTQIARHRDGKEAQVAISTSVLSKIIETRAGVVTADTGTDQLFNRASSLLAQSIGSAMCVPMIRGQELIGLIHLDSRSASGIFSDKDLDLFTVIASQAAVAIDRSLLAEQVIGAATLERQRLPRPPPPRTGDRRRPPGAPAARAPRARPSRRRAAARSQPVGVLVEPAGGQAPATARQSPAGRPARAARSIRHRGPPRARRRRRGDGGRPLAPRAGATGLLVDWSGRHRDRGAPARCDGRAGAAGAPRPAGPARDRRRACGRGGARLQQPHRRHQQLRFLRPRRGPREGGAQRYRADPGRRGA